VFVRPELEEEEGEKKTFSHHIKVSSEHFSSGGGGKMKEKRGRRGLTYAHRFVRVERRR